MITGKNNTNVSIKVLRASCAALSFNLDKESDVDCLSPVIEKYYRDNNYKKVIITQGKNDEVCVHADLRDSHSLVITGLDYDAAIEMISKAIDKVDCQEFIKKVKKFKWQRT